jgi:protease-4
MIWHELHMLAQEKPLVVSMGAYAASGGYYISAPAKRIVAEPTTVTGSIGVIGMLPSLKPFKEKYGVSFYAVTQSDRQNLVDMGATPTAEDRRLIVSTIDQVYRTFLEKVASGRHMKVEDVDALAQGRVYTGVEALKLGLVDELGGMQSAFKAAKELAGFDVDKLYPVHRYEGERRSLTECLAKKNPGEIFKCVRGGATLSLPRHGAAGLAERAADAQARLESWLAGPPQALALWPGYLSLSVR